MDISEKNALNPGEYGLNNGFNIIIVQTRFLAFLILCIH